MIPAAADFASLVNSDPALFDVQTTAAGPPAALPLTEELLREAPSGDLFGWTQDAGMGWKPAELGRREFLILSTSGGVRNPDGTPIALGYHTGHWEVGLLMKAAAEELKSLGCIPFAGFCTDPCDGRTQGTTGMMDSLPYRNDAAMVLRRLIRSLPTRRGVLGVATCDKGLPAMMMALAAMHDLPCVLVPGGVTLPPTRGRGRRQDPVHRRPLRARRDHACRRRPTWAAGPAHRRAAAASFSAPRPRRRSSPRRSACRCRTPPWRRPASRSGSTWPAARRGPSAELETRQDPHAAHSHRRRRAQCHDGPRGLRRLDQPAAAHPRHRLRRRAAPADGRGLDRGQPPDAAAGRRAAQRPGRPSDGARLPGRRRAGSDAAPAPPRPARRDVPDRHRRTAGPRPRLVGEHRNAGDGCATCCEKRTASIPTT